jgi:hypothetical protein
MNYGTGHDTTRGFSPAFQAYLEDLVTCLIDRYDLRGKAISEIGCGQGEFLKLLCSVGKNRGIGFDPSYVDSGGLPAEGVRFILENYSEAYANDYPADAVCCRHTLEHIPQPTALMSAMRQGVGGRDNTLVFFEVPSIEWIFANEANWALTYEHCSWYSPESMAYLFESQGFDVVRVTEAFDREYIWLEAFPQIATISRAKFPANNRLSDISRSAVTFGERFLDKSISLRAQFDDVRNKAARFALWGAAGKGVTLLNILNVGPDEMEYVIDINPSKQGGYIPGTGQEIVPLEAMAAFQPEVVMVTNSIYVEEMRRMLAAVDLYPELVLIQ